MEIIKNDLSKTEKKRNKKVKKSLNNKITKKDKFNILC